MTLEAIDRPRRRSEGRSWGKPVRQLLERCVDLVYPPVCRSCGGAIEEDRELICRHCWHEVQPIDDPACVACGMPRKNHGMTGQCERCPEGWPEGAVLRSALTYKGPIGPLVRGLKFDGSRELAEPLGRWLVWGFERHFGGQRFNWVVPVPLHKRRERKREFNQATLIAQVLAERLEIPLALDALVRWRNTAPQTSLPGRDRQKNVAGAFRAGERSRIEGQRILVIDDVVTTGSTVSEIARVVLNAGARHVSVLSAARVTNG